MSGTRVAPSVNQFLSAYPPAIRALANELRKILKAAVPDVNERVYTGWKLIGYRVVTGKSDRYFGFIAPFPDRVEIGFEYGALLEDPHSVLNKKLKQVHSLVVRSKSDIPRHSLSSLIHQAAMIAIERGGLRK